MTVVETARIGVLVERRHVGLPWADYSWRPVAAVANPPDLPDWTLLRQDSDAEGRAVSVYHAGVAELTLYSGETETYIFNLNTDRPAIYVLMRRLPGAEPPLALYGATVDAGEAQAHHESGDDLIEPVPIPQDIMAWVLDFCARHPAKTQDRWKRQRDKVDPERLARRSRIDRPAGPRTEEP